MRIALLVNPASGSGHGLHVGQFVAEGLREVGLGAEVVAIDTRDAVTTRGRVRAALARAQAAAVVGGDGTLHHALADLIKAQVPVYHVPLGTENLFARAMGSYFARDYTSNVHQLAAWAQGRRPKRMDVMQLRSREGNEPFAHGAIMCTVGPDASVVRRLALVRKGPISHLTYVWPALKEAVAPHLPALRVRVDGREIVQRERGWLVIANLPEYARGVNPCRDAKGGDGVLDVGFFPASSTLATLVWFARCMTRRQCELDSAMQGAVFARGEHVEFAGEEQLAMQVDGDWLKLPGEGRGCLVSVRSQAMPVLTKSDVL